MKAVLLVALLLWGCRDKREPPRANPPQGSSDPWAAPSTPREENFARARAAFRTKPMDSLGERMKPEMPPPGMQLVKYDAPPGKLHAYLTSDPGDGKKHPAIVWIVGGDISTIGDVWSPREPENDQSARQYREAGVVTMYPSLRGAHDNPGRREAFYGEVDDVIAAAAFLAKQPYVDPAQIYLGGHSTGGTLVMLVAAAAPAGTFRAAIAFGPTDDILAYGETDFTRFDTSNEREIEMRSTSRWINSIATPTFVLEGAADGNIDSIHILKAASKNARVRLELVEGRNHFDLLAPGNTLFASRIAGAWATGTVSVADEKLDSLSRTGD